MNKEDVDVVKIWVACIVMVVVFIGAWVGAATSEAYYKKQAIERGYAQYNTETGDWEWKSQVEKK